MSANVQREPGSPLTASRPAMSAGDFSFACAKRRQGASWDAIGRMLDRPADAVRRACDPSYTPLHQPAVAVATSSPSDALCRRLKADGVAVPVAEFIAAVFSFGGAPASSLAVLERARSLPIDAGLTARVSAFGRLRKDAAEAGYSVTVTKAGCAFNPAVGAAIAARLAKPVR